MYRYRETFFFYTGLGKCSRTTDPMINTDLHAKLVLLRAPIVCSDGANIGDGEIYIYFVRPKLPYCTVVAYLRTFFLGGGVVIRK